MPKKVKQTGAALPCVCRALYRAQSLRWTKNEFCAVCLNFARFAFAAQNGLPCGAPGCIITVVPCMRARKARVRNTFKRICPCPGRRRRAAFQKVWQRLPLCARIGVFSGKKRAKRGKIRQKCAKNWQKAARAKSLQLFFKNFPNATQNSLTEIL